MAITRTDPELAKKSSSSQLSTSSPGGTKQTTSDAFNPSIGNLLNQPEQNSPKAPGASSSTYNSPSSRKANHGDTNQPKPADEGFDLTPSRRRTRSNRVDTESQQHSRSRSSRGDEPPVTTGGQPLNPIEGRTTQALSEAEVLSDEVNLRRIIEALGRDLPPSKEAKVPSKESKVPSQESNMPPRKAKIPSKESNMPAKKAKVPWDGGDDPSLKNYWLFKAEQEDRFETLKSGRRFNTKFTIDDLRSKTAPEPWDGVRNAVAAKNMRSMKKGDEGFFYASGGKAGRKPGITGIVEVVGEAEPDVTTADEDSYGYVEKESDRDRWCVVHVEFRKKLSRQVTLKELQQWAQGDGELKDMQVLNTARLSVSKVTKPEWDFIVDSLINGAYEDDDDAPAAEDTEQKTKPTVTATAAAATVPAGEDSEDEDLDEASPLPTPSAPVLSKKAKGKRRAIEEEEPPRKSTRRSIRRMKR